VYDVDIKGTDERVHSQKKFSHSSGNSTWMNQWLIADVTRTWKWRAIRYNAETSLFYRALVQALNTANKIYSACAISVTKITSNLLCSFTANVKAIISENMRWRIAVCIAISYGLVGLDFESRQGNKFLCFPECPSWLCGPNSILLTLILLTWRIGWAPNNAISWQMGFNLAFKGWNWYCGSFSGEMWPGHVLTAQL